MGSIKDIVDLAKELESRAKDRKDIDTLRQIMSIAFELQSNQLEVMERDIRLVEENSELKRKLAETNSEESQLIEGIEYRKGARTGEKWAAFCPKCHLPAKVIHEDYPVECSANCGWGSDVMEDDLKETLRRINS